MRRSYFTIFIQTVVLLGLGVHMPYGFGQELDVLKIENTVFIRSAFSDDYDVVVSMRPGVNRQMDFYRTALIPTSASMTAESCMAGEVIHVGVDDSTPSITIESGDTVPEAGLSVSVKGDYGYVVLLISI